MKILITNHHLQEYTGTEISTLTLAKYLSKNKHEIVVYSKYLHQNLTDDFKKLKINVVNDLEIIKEEKFDIIHIQHNICAFEVKKYFPDTPLVMWVHGVIPYLEKPPFIDINISKFLVNNKEGFDYVNNLGVPKEKIIIYRNLIDSEKFYQTSKINIKPKRALIISNKITPEKEYLLKKVLERENIEYKFAGMRFECIPNHELINEINKVDIVFTLGLGAIESMFCGRIPIIYDCNLNDGIVTSKNFDFLKEYNFSGRATKQIFNENDLTNEIKKYNKKDSLELKKLALEHYDAKLQVKRIENIYIDVIKNYKKKENTLEEKNIINNILEIVEVTKYFSGYNTHKHSITHIKNLENELFILKKDTKIIKRLTEKNLKYIKLKSEINILNNKISQITNSKYYKIWRSYCYIKEIFIRKNGR